MGFSRSWGDDHRPTLSEVRESLRAGAIWVGARDLPDVDAWADFEAAPGLVHQRMVSRVMEGRCPSLAHAFPLPKPGKDEVRRMAWLNLYDELLLRIIVGRVASSIDAALGPDVLSYRLVDQPPGWSVQDIREAFRLRRERGKRLLADECCIALAVTDLRQYYPSITPEVVMEALRKAEPSSAAIPAIGGFLRELVAVGAPVGLPVGPEASGLLGNIVLLTVDEAVSERVCGHVRYMDDSWMFLRAASDWPEVYEAYAASASTLGLKANASKVAVYDKCSGAAEKALQHEEIAYLVSDASRHRTPQMSAEQLRSQLSRDDPDWALASFHLGSLRHARSTHGLAVLYDYPEVLQELPRHTGRYLAGLASCKQGRGQIDRDWLMDRATGPHTSRSLAGQLQACRVASQLRLGKHHGERLEDLATDTNLLGHVPLQAWAARAWGASKAHKPGRAVEYACHLGDFSVRRALALTIHPDASTPSRRACWRRKLSSVDADLEPTLARLS